MIALSVAKLKIFSPESEIFLWIRPKMKKKNFVLSLDQCQRLEVRENARNVFLWWAYVCLNTRCYTTSHRSDFLAFFAHISYFKFSEFKELNKTIIPFALVGYETGYSQLGTTRLVGYLPSHTSARGIIVDYSVPPPRIRQISRSYFVKQNLEIFQVLHCLSLKYVVSDHFRWSNVPVNQNELRICLHFDQLI